MNTVVFPAPLGPITPTMPFGGKVKSRLLNRRLWLYAFESRSFRLYEQADKDSPYKEIFVESVHDYPPVGVRNLTFILLDVDGEFRKVMFVSYGRTYIGWIDHYCDDVYGCYGR